MSNDLWLIFLKEVQIWYCKAKSAERARNALQVSRHQVPTTNAATSQFLPNQIAKIDFTVIKNTKQTKKPVTQLSTEKH